ncbi:adhesion G-protein coupled receptor V1 [Polypterus senegalus]|uniref:adhesion G-protein coupled receptor V1 n=1 Tax=Polypterus senegalus TaxID=55291 RepID=UPI0019645322|nr:adhesion G-protein coupled receptor V1 [Polypterus senegalus]
MSGMPPVFLLSELLFALSITLVTGDTELMFFGETKFVVEESSTSVVRLIIIRTGDPVAINALVLLKENNTGDFEADSYVARLDASETNKTIFIAVRDDDIPEADETFSFSLYLLGMFSSVKIGSPDTAIITILSNDNAFGIISFNVTSLIMVNETRGTSQIVPLSLIREKGTYGTVTVNFEITGGPNPAEEDFTPSKGNITLPPGRANVEFVLQVKDDQVPEDDEIFTIQLTDVEGGAEININHSSIQIKINKNDSPIKLTQSFLAVQETADIITIQVTRGRDELGRLIGSDSEEVSIDYAIETAGAVFGVDFEDLQQNKTRIVFLSHTYVANLKFRIIDDKIPEIGESFILRLKENTITGDAVLQSPSMIQIIIEPNDEPYGVLSINSGLMGQKVIINEDLTMRFEGINITRNGGTHGNVSVNWTITRNSSDFSPVSMDLIPVSGTLRFSEGQSSASPLLSIISDDLPEQAEAYLFKLLPRTVNGGAKVDDPTEMVFYIQDSDDVYGLIQFQSVEEQKIQSHPSGRFVSLSLVRQKGTVGDVRLHFTALYIPPGDVDPARAKEGVLNSPKANSVVFSEGQAQLQVNLAIRNDSFLQNGAHFFVQLESVELVSITPLIPSVSPRLGGILNISLIVTQNLANGMISFTSNQTVVVYEPETTSTLLVPLQLQRDGTDGKAEVFWRINAVGPNQRDVTSDDLSPFSGSVTFLSGQNESSINITIKADDIPELNETLDIFLERTNDESLIFKTDFTRRQLIIVENDDPGGVFAFSPRSLGPWFINEGESVELRVVRSQGNLLKQLLRYEVLPSNGNEFYGSQGILEFQPGEREVVMALLARPDGIPELDEQYSVVLSSHSIPPSKLGTATQVNITIRKNDDPHGVIQFSTTGLTITVNESKVNDIDPAVYMVKRDKGTFGEVSVFWHLSPSLSQDVYPVLGILYFAQHEVLKNITLMSLPDELPEDLETFSVTLYNATGGARLGNALTATLQITKNDYPIYFVGPPIVRIQEGETANFTIMRNGSSDFVATVMYRIVNVGTNDGDIVSGYRENLIVFEFGEWMKNISVATVNDDIPEADESFEIILYNATGDAVVYGAKQVTAVIEANDDASGIFSLETLGKSVEEGSFNNFMVIRNRGIFGMVTIHWQIYENGSALAPGLEFSNTSGSIIFQNGEEAQPITLHAVQDNIPEFSELYLLMLTNISGGFPGTEGKLASTNLNATVIIPPNDDPFGLFVIDPGSRIQEVAEDVLTEDDMSDITSFTVLRQLGTFGMVRVGWEIQSDAFTINLPPMIDLIMQSSFPDQVELRPHMRRHHSATDALYFSGNEGAFGSLILPDPISKGQTLTTFTFSAWLIPSANTNGFIVSKGTENGTMFYGIKIETNESYVSLFLYYTPSGYNVTHIAKAKVMRNLEENAWLHVIISLGNGTVHFYLDGNLIPGSIKSLKGNSITDGPALLRIGAGLDGKDRYAGLMQDVRMYSGWLSQADIHELHRQSAKADLRNISGYLQYQPGETRKSFIVEVRDDVLEEGEESFTLRLISVHGGARLSGENATAKLIIQKSDYANGLFGFTGPCSPNSTDEGSTISCVVERTRGTLDYVYVNYTITQLNSSSYAYVAEDFVNSSGTITFLPGQESKALNIYILDDDIPEFAELFRVTLMSVRSGDGKQGSTPTSGASIDPEKASTNIIIKESDYPTGLLQFSLGPVPNLTGGFIKPALQAPSITVKEEVGEISLLVLRAQGLLGRVLVGYKTVPLTAVSPKDYREIEGTLEFLPGEYFKYIRVNITDNFIPELDKSFKVQLYNPNGGVDEFFRSEGSGSGVGGGETDFFLPALHQRASLGPASHILVTIEASDDAHGIFQFSMDSLNVNGTEPEDGYSTVVLQVKRIAGALSRTTIFWEADTNASDLVTKVGNVTFDIGQNEGSIVIQISSDEVPELDKTFVINLINVSNGRLGMLTKSNLTVLASDDPYGIFIFSNNSKSIRVQEGNKTTVLVIQRLKGLMGSVKVGYETVKDNEFSAVIPFSTSRAKEGSDFLPVSGFVTFVANQSEANITLNILDDTEPERAESVFIQLTNVSLIQGVQQRTIVFSPRLGLKIDTISEVIIEASDDAFGILSLSSSTISVAENYVGPIINVTRTGGIFADVSVKFRAFPMTARVGEDYTVASSDVVLLDGETSKPVPIHINNDDNPEIEETFRIELLNQTTGGALLGDLTQAIITIEASDDPYGSFVFQVVSQTIEEPDVSPTTVNLTIVRNSGTLGNVTVQWAALINGQFAFNDIHPVTGRVSFAPGETIKTLTVQILPDDVPEIEEVIRVELTSASNGGSIGQLRSVNLIVPPNDNPYGTVTFRQLVYRVREPLEGTFSANITVRRSGGFFGQLQILYSTSEVDVVGMALLEGQNILSYYDLPVKAVPAVPVRLQVNVTLQKNDFLACAAFCLRERACQAFSFFNNSGVPRCDWSASLANGMTNTTDFLTYRKNLTMVSALFSSQAIAGSDFESKTGSVAMMLDGQETANLTVSILSDALPEVDEMFTIQLLAVNLLNISSSPKNKPSIGQPDRANITIAMNGDAFGVFLIYSTSPNATERGLYLEVQEQPQTTVYLVIERRGGSLGQVTIEWSVVGGSATPNIDFTGTGEVLTFADGDLKKTIQLTILDDIHPEENETIVVSLTQTEGGSRILPSSDTVTIVILANDNVAGVIGFQTTSRSVIMREGETVQLHVERSFPGSGNVTVNWNIQGPRVQQNFINVSGVLFFSEGTLNATITVNLLDDGIPEEREEYRVVLSNVITKGVHPTGAAALDKQGFEAVLTVEASDEPYGVLKFAPSSKMIFTREENKTLQLFITREFGSLGAINITYETVKGSLQPLNMTEVSLAEPGLDFLPVSGFIVLQPGQTSAVITVTILEDEVPELAEIFLINITSAVLITYHPSVASPHLDIQGLVSQITIDASDGVRGIIAWKSINFEVNETDTSLTLVAYRNAGTYGNVSLFFNVQSLEAQLGFDFNVTPTVLHFVDGERYKVIEVMIFDDIIPEGDEKFQLILVNPSYGLELGAQTTATVTILANDDGHGVISFNNSDHFLLKEPTSLNLGESTATLYIIRDPPQGTFGMVTVRYLVSGLNGSDASHDLTPTEGFIVLKDGERFQTLQISAILDEEPEMNETFIITLSDPTGGARMGMVLQSFITVLQNQAPLGLFRIFPINRTSPVIIEEGNRTLYLGISRSNGLDTTVTVEWETQPVTAYGFGGNIPFFSAYQNLLKRSFSGWCSFTLGDSLYGFLLESMDSILYKWQGVFVPIQSLKIQNPRSCTGFSINGSAYVGITHGGQDVRKPQNTSLFWLAPDRNLTLIQHFSMSESNCVMHFVQENYDYLIIGSQVFSWNGKTFVFLQNLNLVNVTGLSVFVRGNILYLTISILSSGQSCLLYQWDNNQFLRFQSLPINFPSTQVETFLQGANVYLLLLTQGFVSTCEVFVWQAGALFFQHIQSIIFSDTNMINSLTPSSGIVHVLFAGNNRSAIYSWKLQSNQFEFLLDIPAAKQMHFFNVRHFNSTKALVAAAEDSSFVIYELTYISNQSDFIPSSGELKFEPGNREHVIAVNIIEDNLPEEEESFRVQLKNPKGGAEIGPNGFVTVIIPPNDNAYGVVAFAQNSLTRMVEELEQDNLVTLNVERLRGTFGRITVYWAASGSLSDIRPTSGVITFSEGQVFATLSITILADSLPELSETVTVNLTQVVTLGIQDPLRGALIDAERFKAEITILPSDSPYGVIGWHTDSFFFTTQEPEGNPKNISLKIVREQGFVGDVIIYYKTTPVLSQLTVNQAKDREDYVAKEDTLIMKENVMMTSVQITVLPDSVPELSERFLVNITKVELVNASAGSGQPSVKRVGMETAEVIIEENDDPRGIVQFNVKKDMTGGVAGYELLPPRNLLRLPVIRLAGTFGKIVIDWMATPVSASFEDFTPANGTLVFTDGQDTAVIEITIVDDNIIEFSETFNVSLTRISGGARLGNDSSIMVYIPPNDSPVGLFSFEMKTVTAREPQFNNDPSGMVTLSVMRNEGARGAVQIVWLVEEAAKDDITPLNGTLFFNETDTKKTIPLYIVKDSILEGEERFIIQLVSATNNAEINPVDGSATVIILGDPGSLGRVGISPLTQNVLIGEPFGLYNGTALISVLRGPGIYGEITVFWNITPSVSSEFEETSGFITMKNQQSAATIRLKTIDDDIPEEKLYYQLTLTRVSEGAEINESSRSSNITMVASDVPYGRFSFSQEFLETLEEQRLVSVTISRSMGKFGRVQLWYQTTSGTAVGGFDFSPVNGQIIFEKEEVNKTISVEVLNDNIPEGPEEFFLNITRVELLPGSAFDFTIREGGLQLDQPPTIGNISTLTVVIQKNDNAEGIIEFDPKYLIFVVSEDVGMLQIPVFRRQGTFGLVTGEYISKGSTALPNMDYILPNGSVVFYHGQNQSFINVSIIDDADREYDEHFEIQLTAATGGAVLGTNLTTRVTIAKSDSPNGLVRFLNQTQLVIPNPNSTLALTFVLERTGGLAGAAEVTWNILGPNSKDFLLPGNTDIGEPLNGSFSFGDGEGGVRAITLKILPHSDVEVQESFIIKLSLLSGEMDIDAKAGNITLIIQKFGDPNGVVQFALDALMERTFIEPNNSGGPLSISFPVTRVQGTTGNITVFWEIRSNSDMTGDFLSFQGSITILDMQRSGEITIKLLPDDIPEMDELYSVWLTSVDGGAEIDINNSSSRFTVKSNDDPHGLFAIYSPLQSVTVGQDLMRYIVLNVTRLAGTFGNVTVEYKITANTPGGDFFMDKVLGNLIIRDGAKFGTSTVPISNQIFYAVGFNFSIELSNVTLVKGQPDISPRIQAGAKTALVYIPEEAANSEVGFDNIALQIANLSSSICTFMITRKGVYGSVTVEWNSGYPVGQAPLGFPVGQILPSTGILTLGHGERNRTVPLTVILNNTKPEAFAVYIKTLNSSNPGGARLRSGFTIAEVEPLGIFQFAPSYRQLVIEEDDQVVTLYVQKLFGFRSKQTRLTFQTLAGSAKPKEDFVPVEKGELLFEALQYEASIHLSVLNDNISESDEIFYVKLINVTEKNGNLIHTMPRLIQEFSTASITISANDVINGFMSIGPSLVQIAEDSRNGIQQTVVLRVHRSVGFTGAIQVMVKTFGGKSITSGLLESPFGIQLSELNHIWAREGEDFQDQMLTVTFQEGEKEANVSFKILDDSDPEGSEVFYVYLTNPQGGAQILPGIDDKGYTSFAKILILGNDFQNGIVGFTLESQTGLVLDEDSEKRKVLLTVERQTNRVFEDLVVLWQATLNESNALLQNNEVNLTKELLFISGSTTCKKGEVTCTFTLELRQDKTPEFETWFLVELYQVGEGAMINNSARFANITILESDNPRGLIYFAVGSRLPVVHQKTTLISLRVTREPSNSVVSVSYETRELKKEEPVGRGLIWPAIAGMDFENSQGVLTLDVGESTTAFNITLTPDRASSNPLPKRFQVVLSDATGGARVDAEFGIANVTIVSDTETQAVWGLVEQLHQPLETNIINQVLQSLHNKVTVEVTEEQLGAVFNILGKVMLEGERISLEKTSRGLTYDVLCALANPNRKDTRGLSQLSETAERFAFSLLTDVQCGSEGERGKTILDTCPHLAIKAYHWYPPQINGHQFMGKNGDWIRVPEALLKVSTVSPYEVAENKCEKIQFTEYSSQQWFLTGKPTALNNKIFSLSLMNKGTQPLSENDKVIYRIYTSDSRIKPQQSLCLLWSQTAENWLPDEKFCQVTDDTSNFVECACSHMSIYTAFAQTDSLSSYNQAFFSAGFICMSGFSLAILSHLFCSKFSMFSAKLLIHMMVACFGTQVSFLVSAYGSRQLSEEGCSALGLVTHYLYLSQFTWMLIQAVNFWQVLVMNDEHTERRYLIFFTLSWGLPAFIIALLVIVLRGAYHWNISDIYGLIYGDMCFIPNVYAALSTAALVPLACLVGVLVVFIHVYQVTHQWKAYDDIFKGRTNSTEVPLVLYLFGLISFVWLWGGLYMAYRQLWMLIFFVIFNTLLGLYVFVVYFILHNQLCWPVKASYSMEMNGHTTPGSPFQGTGIPSIDGEISKSTQNLITAMEEVPADWERTSLRPNIESTIYKHSLQEGDDFNTQGGFTNESLVADEESQDFDDLIFALKTGSGLNVSDTESCHGSQDEGSVPNSQIVELRRIPIADTHL